MKILKELDDAKLVIVDLEVRLGDEVRSAPTLCARYKGCLLYTSPSPRDRTRSRMPSSA